MLTLSPTYNRNVLMYGIARNALNGLRSRNLIQENQNLPLSSFSINILSIKYIIILPVQNQTSIYTQRRTTTVEHTASNLKASVFHPEATRLPSTGPSSVRGTTFHSSSVHCSPASLLYSFHGSSTVVHSARGDTAGSPRPNIQPAMTEGGRFRSERGKSENIRRWLVTSAATLPGLKDFPKFPGGPLSPVLTFPLFPPPSPQQRSRLFR